ncbi:FAD-dependent oxidoreductase [Nonomuraea sp. NPDC059194]|uniref:GcvT family protein n=1 Tax=Nonomuraea sp. NPDC059194 TaxID=3346764 RepID=UPI00368CE8CC
MTASIMGIPDSAQAIVIGGGVAGCSVAYHLARLGWRDVVLVEQHELTEGTTWHSAGFVGQLRSTVTQTRMIMYSAGLYPELAELTGLDPGWHGVGGLRLATTHERVEELVRQAGAAETYGLDMSLLSGRQTNDLMPMLHDEDVLASLWLPGDGWLDPASLARALAEGAAKLGVRIVTGVRVTGVDVAEGAVRAIRLRGGGEDWVITTDTVVNCAGAAAGQVGALAGVDVPIVPIKHQYVVTHPADIPSSTPTVRDPDNIVYFREHEGGILVGGYIRTPEIWEAADPLARSRELFAPNLPKFRESWAAARHRLPVIAKRTTDDFDETQVARIVHGPEAFTPDGEFLLGETAVRGFWVAAGFCVHGLAAAGGVGKVMAEWIVDGVPEYDLFGMDVRRFGGYAGSSRWARTKALDSYAKYYDIVYPGEERTAARPLRRSPAWPRHADLDAAFGEKAGWERVNWFGSNTSGSNASGDGPRPLGWAGRVWSPAVREECLATRDAAGLFDQTSFAKLEVSGPGALDRLQRLCANQIDTKVGTVVYTQLLNRRGGIEADLTVTRLGEDSFRLVTGTAYGTHDAAWLRRNGLDVTDVTSAYACYCLWGPQAGEILERICDDDLGFPYLRARRISVANVPVLAQRVTFVGEYGWELYCPAEYGLTLWDALMAAGLPYGMRPGGYRAIDSMRLEKGYRVWGLDITPETTPYEAGLGFAVRADKDFLGKDALDPAPERTLRCLVLRDPRRVCLGGEPVRVDGVPASRVTSGGYGHRVDASIAYAYLRGEPEEVTVGVDGTWVEAVIEPRPPYDPGNERIRPPAP